ncbi:MAG TPA: GNAT family N-acetyltransferase [Steroidobacteraceae bacterium]|jgi:GNAT superfamily N-acetyltransferase|nr:GNAT family N-acetyltransferase [Steroidobacteraceae bacterium]
MPDGIVIRPAQAHELGEVLAFIRELAAYEHLADQVLTTEADLAAALFGPRPCAEVVFACDDAQPVGFALFFHNFSTFRGKPGLYLEDLFVRPAARGRGIGRRLLAWLARSALERGCARLEWAVLDWNAPSIAFYRKLGALPQEEWTTFRLTDAALERLARA